VDLLATLKAGRWGSWDPPVPAPASAGATAGLSAPEVEWWPIAPQGAPAIKAGAAGLFELAEGDRGLPLTAIIPPGPAAGGRSIPLPLGSVSSARHRCETLDRASPIPIGLSQS
jgi:hypothetical protein